MQHKLYYCDKFYFTIEGRIQTLFFSHFAFIVFLSAAILQQESLTFRLTIKLLKTPIGDLNS